MTDDGALATAGPSDVVTVVVTTCDRPAMASRAVRSALQQSHGAVEVLVVDDGSAVRWEPDDPDDVRVLRTPGRIGVTRARNLGLANATGSWTTFLDDDDELLPDAVASGLRAAAASGLPSPVAVVACMEEVGPDGEVQLLREPRSVARGGAYDVPVLDRPQRIGMGVYNTLLAPTELLRGIGGFDERITAWMHTDLFLRVNEAASLQASDTVAYRMHHHDEGQRLSKAHRARAHSMRRVLRKHSDTFAAYPHRRGQVFGEVSLFEARAGRWTAAGWWWCRALAAAPTRRGAWRELRVVLGELRRQRAVRDA